MANFRLGNTATAIAAGVIALAASAPTAMAGAVDTASFVFNSTQDVGTLGPSDPYFLVVGKLTFDSTNPITTQAGYALLNPNPTSAYDNLAADNAQGFTDYQIASFAGYLEEYNGGLTNGNTGLATGFYNNITKTGGIDSYTGFSPSETAATNYFVTATGVVYDYSGLTLAPVGGVTKSSVSNDNILGVLYNGVGAVDDSGIGLLLTGTAAQNEFGTSGLVWFDSSLQPASYNLDNGQEILGGLNIDVPEPFTLGLLGAGLVGLGLTRRRRTA